MDTIEKLRAENERLKKNLIDAIDVLRFCAMPNVGTYYQQESAKAFVTMGTKLVWDRNNQDGTYNERHKQWIFKCGGQEALDAQLALERELLKPCPRL